MSVSETEGRRFESSWAHRRSSKFKIWCLCKDYPSIVLGCGLLDALMGGARGAMTELLLGGGYEG